MRSATNNCTIIVNMLRANIFSGVDSQAGGGGAMEFLWGRNIFSEIP